MMSSPIPLSSPPRRRGSIKACQFISEVRFFLRRLDKRSGNDMDALTKSGHDEVLGAIAMLRAPSLPSVTDASMDSRRACPHVFGGGNDGWGGAGGWAAAPPAVSRRQGPLRGRGERLGGREEMVCLTARDFPLLQMPPKPLSQAEDDRKRQSKAKRSAAR